MFNWDEIYQKTSNVWGIEPTRIIKKMIRKTKNPLNILDIGCGYGRDAIPIAEMGHIVTGIDKSPTALSNIDGRIKTIYGDIEDVEIDIEKFDVIYSIASLYGDELRDTNELMEKIMNALKPGGLLILIILDDLELSFTFFSNIRNHLEETSLFFRCSSPQKHLFDTHIHETYTIFGRKRRK